MLIKINGQQQMSFEQFEETFRHAFGREMTSGERNWFAALVNSPANPFEQQNSAEFCHADVSQAARPG